MTDNRSLTYDGTIDHFRNFLESLLDGGGEWRSPTTGELLLIRRRPVCQVMPFRPEGYPVGSVPVDRAGMGYSVTIPSNPNARAMIEAYDLGSGVKVKFVDGARDVNEAAERRLADSRKATEQHKGTIQGLRAEFKALRKAGADPAILRAKREEIKAEQARLRQGKIAGKAAEDELQDTHDKLALGHLGHRAPADLIGPAFDEFYRAIAEKAGTQRRQAVGKDGRRGKSPARSSRPNDGSVLKVAEALLLMELLGKRKTHACDSVSVDPKTFGTWEKDPLILAQVERFRNDPAEMRRIRKI